MVTANPPLNESEKIQCGVAKNPPTRPPISDGKIVVASYNIRYAVGRYLISGGLLRKLGWSRTGTREQKVRENIRLAGRAFREGILLPPPTIIALQEADKQTARAGRQHVASELAERLGMNWVHVPAGIPRGIKPVTRQWWLDFEEPIDLHDTGDTGVALLSYLEMKDLTRIDLPWHECPWRPRQAMAATVSVSGKNLRIVNAHVDPHVALGGQLEQLEVLVAEADKSTDPTLVLGDFNTLSNSKVGETRKFLESHGYSTPFVSGTATWRGMGLRMHADWIFQRGVKITRCGVARPLGVSDHWPIWAQVDLS
ncbi:MAG TPA: endonuclease/exonuclease/phosphatase family protein [Pyrinomonadaceae bacterium]|nr:endonuclease/exonuclease/phosphatase family protein [Pyrinomonadaceae bacterium]